MRKTFIMAMVFYALNANAQSNLQNYIYLKNDSLIYENDIRLERNYVDEWDLRVNNRRMPLNKVMFFSTNDGYFANTNEYDRFGDVKLAERIISGRINVFKEIIKLPNMPYALYRRGINKQNLNAVKEFYYNKNYKQLRVLNYNNLKEDIKDDPQSLAILNTYNKSNNTANLMYVSAGVSFIVGIIAMSSSAKNASFTQGPNMVPGLLFLGISTGLAIGGYTTKEKAKNKLHDAIEHYNR